MKTIALILLGMSFSAFATGGDWSSGGGALIRTAENPWFVENTKTVNYCVEKDNQYFANLPTPVEGLIQLALQYWVDGAARASAPNYNGWSLKIATQSFIRQAACNSQTDLTFYFGKVPPDIGNYIADTSAFVGATVRTAYDEVNLKGKGFIYISADGGPLSYSTEYATPNAWHLGQGGLLLRALVHELGHVFGLPHITASLIMDEHFPQELLSFLSYETKLNPIWPTFEGPLSDGTFLDSCGAGKNPRNDFFEVPIDRDGEQCLRLTYDVKAKTGTASSHGTTIGTISNVEESTLALGGVRLWLPKAQTVFPQFQPFLTIQGPEVQSRQIHGVYTVAKTRETKQLLLTLNSLNWVKGPPIGGIINGQLHLEFFPR